METPGISKPNVQSLTQEDGSAIPSYCEEAKKVLESVFPGTSSGEIDAVFLCCKCDLAKAYDCLLKVQEPPIFQVLRMIPSDQSRHETTSFNITSNRLRCEIQAIPELREKFGNDLLCSGVAEQIEALVETVNNEYKDILHPGLVREYKLDFFFSMTKFFLDMLKLQKEFASKGLPGYVDVGFHFTSAANIRSIESNGLKASTKGYFGPGIYTANNPHSFSARGDTCLVVARLQGQVVQISHRALWEVKNTNTIIGNKKSDGHSSGEHDEIVLKSQSQCSPMIRFDRGLIDNKKGKQCIAFMKDSLQSILDDHFNVGFEKATPSLEDLQRFIENCHFHSLEYQAPSNLGIPAESTIEPPPSCELSEECAICHEVLSTKRCSALLCKHVFHHDCIEESFARKPQCPICRASVGAPQGTSPSGTMTVWHTLAKCDGFDCGSFLIEYNIPPALQLSYHPSPGSYHGGKLVTAYLPFNDEGRALLKRLKFAFHHGLTFTVGTSLTTGKSNQCTWASIHHKTARTGGIASHGFPDDNYFTNCSQELDSLCVPAAESLNEDGKVIPQKESCS